MSMFWDSPLVAAVAKELEALLRGARLRAHRFAWEERELTLYFSAGALKWRLHPRRGWVTFHPGSEIPEDARALSARVIEVLAPPDERRLEIRLRKDRGRTRPLSVVVELMTNQWNALLLDGEDRRIRHLLWTRRLDERALAVGQPYLPPEPSGRLGVRTPPTREEWERLLNPPDAEGPSRQSLLESLAFTSPLNLPAFQGSLDEIIPRWEALRDLETVTPCLLEFNGDKKPYPIPIKGYEHFRFPSLLTAIEAAIQDADGVVDADEEVWERLSRALHRARRRVEGLRREIRQAGDPEVPRGQANLLLARLGDVPRGVDEVTLPGFDGVEVRIGLDPAVTPQENARILYEEAARRERVRARLPGLLQQAEAALADLETVEAEVAEGSLSPEEARTRIPDDARPARRRRGREARVPFRRYVSSGGLEIRVGRSSTDNDALTFRHSHPEDIWLHARDRAGAHVILRWQRDGSPPAKDLTEAAVLAALHSGARTSGSVPVDWTRRKYVRKPRKAPPGTVVPERVRTVFVEPDPTLPNRLREREEPRESP